jgi:V-type H+-transporting ATPase subunit A
VIDSLFPIALGSTCTIPGAFGCGKSTLIQAMAKFSNADLSVMVKCGERANELCEFMLEIPELTIVHHGAFLSVMHRSCLVANSSDMPLVSREASIYSGITIAEYYRDMGSVF